MYLLPLCKNSEAFHFLKYIFRSIQWYNIIERDKWAKKRKKNVPRVPEDIETALNVCIYTRRLVFWLTVEWRKGIIGDICPRRGQNMFRSGRMTLRPRLLSSERYRPDPSVSLSLYNAIVATLALHNDQGDYIPLHIIKMTMIVIFLPSCPRRPHKRWANTLLSLQHSFLYNILYIYQVESEIPSSPFPSHELLFSPSLSFSLSLYLRLSVI